MQEKGSVDLKNNIDSTVVCVQYRRGARSIIPDER